MTRTPPFLQWSGGFLSGVLVGLAVSGILPTGRVWHISAVLSVMVLTWIWMIHTIAAHNKATKTSTTTTDGTQTFHVNGYRIQMNPSTNYSQNATQSIFGVHILSLSGDAVSRIHPENTWDRLFAQLSTTSALTADKDGRAPTLYDALREAIIAHQLANYPAST